MKFAVLALLAFSFCLPAGFANPISPLSQSPQQVPVNFSDFGAWASQSIPSALLLADGEDECGDSDGDGQCDDNGSRD